MNPRSFLERTDRTPTGGINPGSDFLVIDALANAGLHRIEIQFIVNMMNETTPKKYQCVLGYIAGLVRQPGSGIDSNEVMRALLMADPSMARNPMVRVTRRGYHIKSML